MSSVECVILIGLPGAGKTTFFRERFAASHDHVSKRRLCHSRSATIRTGGHARMRTSVSILAIVLMVLTAVPRLGAQSHAAPQSALDAAVQQHVAAASADREAVLRVLDRSEVKAVAERAGIDLRRATSEIGRASCRERVEECGE